MRSLLLCLFSSALLTSAFLVSAETDHPLPFPPQTTDDQIYSEPFDAPAHWDEFVGANGVEVRVQNGTYRAYTPGEGVVWGLNHTPHENVMLEVEAVPMTMFVENGFGLMCRADPANNGDGYYFLVTGTGYYSIQVGQGDHIEPLIDWTVSDAIHTGIDSNTVGASCVGERLALYINGEPVAETLDTTYTAGYSGIAVAGTVNGADVAFDNLRIYQP